MNENRAIRMESTNDHNTAACLFKETIQTGRY